VLGDSCHGYEDNVSSKVGLFAAGLVTELVFYGGGSHEALQLPGSETRHKSSNEENVHHCQEND